MTREASAEFEKAVKEVKQFTKAPSYAEKTKLYGLFKIAHDAPHADSRPSVFQVESRAKWDAVQDLKNKNVTAEQAEKEYIEFVESKKESYGWDPDKVVA